MDDDREKSNTRASERKYSRQGLNDDGTVFESSRDVEVVQSFDHMDLKEELLQGIFAYSELLLYDPACHLRTYCKAIFLSLLL